jgi:uncharacterized membrane protein
MLARMNKGRLEAFSDGVIAIVITVMVLELEIPHGTDRAALLAALPSFVSYVLSFVFLGIYWNNHHHLFQVVERVDGRVLWANLHLLFWLSLVPFVTAWMGENPLARLPVGLYGAVLWMAGFAYYLLTRALMALHDSRSTLAAALGRNVKEMASLVLYSTAIGLSFLSAWPAFGLYVVVAIIWLIPDRRIESSLKR